MTDLTRRDVIKAQALIAAATAAGLPIPAAAQNLVTEADLTQLTWTKAPCRFCGTCTDSAEVTRPSSSARQRQPEASETIRATSGICARLSRAASVRLSPSSQAASEISANISSIREALAMTQGCWLTPVQPS